MVWLTIDTSWGFNLGLVQSKSVSETDDANGPTENIDHAAVDSVLALISNPDSRQHVEQLSPSIERLLTEAKLSFSDLGAIAVNIGPSPYTGLRVGITAAKTMQLTLGIPAFGVSCLAVETELGKQAFIQCASSDSVSSTDSAPGSVSTAVFRSRFRADILVVEDSRRRQVYYSFNDSWPQIDFPESVIQTVRRHRPESRAQLRPLVIIGNALAHYQSVWGTLRPDYMWPSHLDQPASALQYVRAAQKNANRNLTPWYLRRPDVFPPSRPHSVRRKT